MSFVSLRKCLSLPKCFSQGFPSCETADFNFFLDGLGHEQAERNTLRSGFGLGAAKNGVWDFECGIHILRFPYLWERVDQRAKSLSVTSDGGVSRCILA
jgi:hypothetical protein